MPGLYSQQPHVTRLSSQHFSLWPGYLACIHCCCPAFTFTNHKPQPQKNTLLLFPRRASLESRISIPLRFLVHSRSWVRYMSF